MRTLALFSVLVAGLSCQGLPASAQPQEDTGSASVLLVANRSSHTVALVDPSSGTVLDEIAVGRGPQQIAVSPDGRRAYVANRGRYPEPHPEPIALEVEKAWVREESTTVSVIDLETRRVEVTFNLAPYTGPHGLVVSQDGATLWVTAEDQKALLELDATTGAIRRAWDTPEGAHVAVATLGDQKLYLANTRVSSVSVLDQQTGKIQTLATGRSPEGFALSPDGRELWVPNRGDDTISIVDVSTDRVLDTIPTHGDFSLELVFSPDGQEVWVSNNNSNDLTVIDATSRQRIATVPLPTQPLGLLMEPEGAHLYVTLPRHNGVSVVDVIRRAVVRHIPTGIEPDGMAWGSPQLASSPDPVVFETADGVTLYGDLYLGPEGKSGPLILAFHQGGGDARGEYGSIAPRLVGLGYSVLAIDQRSGGDRLGGTNRTVEALGGSAPMCDAYLDLEATLQYAVEEGFTGPRVAWGSSYSASHVIRLATEHPNALDGVLAFSPASGGPMADCHSNGRIPEVTIPLLALRPAGEMEIESAATQLALFQNSGHQTLVSSPGTHGSSMLNPDRVEGDVEPTWEAVAGFLRSILKP